MKVYDGDMNAIGKEEQHSHPFSSGWLGRQTPEALKAIAATTSYFFREWCGVPASKLAWTTVKDYRKALQGRGFTRSGGPQV